MPGPYSLDASVMASPNHLSTTLGGDVVILELRDGVYYGLSEVGARIWQLLQTQRTIGDLLHCVVSEFAVTSERAEADLQSLLADFESRGLAVINGPAA